MSSKVNYSSLITHHFADACPFAFKTVILIGLSGKAFKAGKVKTMLETSKEMQSGVGAATIPITKADLEKLEQIYSFRERDEVVTFLEEHPFLVPVLVEAPKKIKVYFGDALLSLKVYFDPEEDFDDLLLYIATKLEVDKALAQLEQMDEAWTLNLSQQVRTNLTIMLDFS